MPAGLWHLCLFYTGEVGARNWRRRGIQYEPYLYKTGLFERSWKSPRVPVETHLKPYVDRRISAQIAFRGLIESIPE